MDENSPETPPTSREPPLADARQPTHPRRLPWLALCLAVLSAGLGAWAVRERLRAEALESERARAEEWLRAAEDRANAAEGAQHRLASELTQDREALLNVVADFVASLPPGRAPDPAVRDWLGRSLDRVDAVVRAVEAVPVPDADTERSLTDLAVLFMKVDGKVGMPGRWRTRSRELLERVFTSVSESSGESAAGSRVTLGRAWLHLGIADLEAGYPGVARSALQRAAALLEPADRSNPRTGPWMSLQMALSLQTDADWALWDKDAAADSARRALESARRVADGGLAGPAGVELADQLIKTARACLRAGRLDEGATLSTEAVALIQRLRKESDEAENWPLLEGSALEVGKLCATAASDDAGAIESAGAKDRPLLWLVRVRVLARRKAPAEMVAAAAEELASRRADGPLRLAFAARGYGLAAGLAVGADADRYAARAVALLRDATGEGAFIPAALRHCPDFAPLRGREDFRQLLAELEGKPAGRMP